MSNGSAFIRRSSSASIACSALCIAFAIGCTGQIGSTVELDSLGSPVDGDGGISNGLLPDGAAAPFGGGASLNTPAVAFPLSRMTSVQYNNTLQDLFAPIAIPDQTPPADVKVESFTNNASAQTPSAALIEAYHASAEEVTTAAMKSSAELLGCTPTGRAEEDACASNFFSTFGRKAFRRPATQAELDKLEGFYSGLRDDGADFNEAITLSLQAILQVPAFLYRVEIGAPIKGDEKRVKLKPFELASRLSYLLWNSMPDEALLAAAESGKLETASDIEKQARRMLADDRAHDAVLNFHREWLRFDKMNNLTKDPAQFPDFDADTAAALKSSAEKTVDSAFFGDGSFTKLLTDNHAWVNDKIAGIYGVASPGPEFELVEVDGDQRSGILTHPGLMAGFAHSTADSPVLRGVFVLNSIMCTPLPPPPATVNTAAPEPDTSKPMTTRQRFETQHEQGSCATCHHTIDGIGFGFSHYDAVGAWRTKDLGLPVDSSGWFAKNAGDLSGTFDDAVELGDKLAKSEQAQTCFAANWLRYALGVDRTGIDRKGLQPILDAFMDNDLDMREMVVALTTSEAFTTRLIAP